MGALYTIQCPGCGSKNEIRNPAVKQITCPYCSSMILVDGDAASLTGKVSRLMPALSGLAIGTAATFESKEYAVAGRVRYGWGEGGSEGYWDEWYLLNNSDEPLWLNEDMGRLSVQRTVPLRIELTPESVKVGASVRANGRIYTITEKGTARCHGAEGQLPFRAISDEVYPFADGAESGGNKNLSIEFDRNGGPTIFEGRPLNPGEIIYTKQENTAKAETGAVIACPSCARPLDPKGKIEGTGTVVCSACFTRVELDGGVAAAAGVLEPKLAKVFTIPSGAEGELRKVHWMVAARFRYDWEDEGERGHSLEYLLYNEEKGYRWLSEEDGEFSLGETVTDAPDVSLFDLIPESRVKTKHGSFRITESGLLTLSYVDGACPWRARIGDVVRYVDAVQSGRTFTEERVGTGEEGETEYFLASRVSRRQVMAAFGLEEGSTRIPAAATSPMPFMRNLLLYSGVLMFIVTGIGAISAMMSGKKIHEESFNLAEAAGKEFHTGSFRTDRPDETVQISLEIGLDNAWTDMGVALFKEEEGAVLGDEEALVEYYYGSEGGESWTEGSRSTDIFWKIPEPGNYSLIVTAFEGDAGSAPVKLEVYRDVMRSWLLFLISIAWLSLPLYARITE
jgi:ribosomal protein S27E